MGEGVPEKFAKTGEVYIPYTHDYAEGIHARPLVQDHGFVMV